MEDGGRVKRDTHTASCIGWRNWKAAFIIAHRLSTILNADEILVLSDGRLIERGTHAQLLGNGSGVYRRLYERQFESAV
jgi:ABC-type multidrug transport system fused ATPase/permease subunit